MNKSTFGAIAVSIVLGACGSSDTNGNAPAEDVGTQDTGNGGADVSTDAGGDAPVGTASLPLELVADVPLTGAAVRFDYQDLDPAKGNLVIAHMNDGSVVVVKTSDGSVVKTITGIPTARGIVVADDVGRIFISSSPDKLVILDNDAFTELGRVTTGSAPDGVGWDPKDKIVGVSDQGDGAASLIANAGDGARTQIPLGAETGNIVYDAGRGVFWITVVAASPPDQLVAIDPVALKTTKSIPLPGCDGAHGLRIHPDGGSALIACEVNDKVARVDLVGDAHAVDLAASGSGPDVMAIDPDLQWLYVAAESGNLVAFDLGRPGLVNIDKEHPGDASHSVAVDPATHHVFFPLVKGPTGAPILRIMKPAGT
jgi:hypothetical protein